MKLMIFLFLLGGWAGAQEFMIRLQMDNAHVEELYFACQAGKSSGYDRGSDIYCPPGGMGDIGLAWFTVPEAKLLPLYKDVRGCEFPQQWTILAQPPRNKGLTFSWADAQFPDGLQFQLTQAEQAIDMRQNRQITVNGKTEINIVVKTSPVSAVEKGNGKK